MKASIVAVGTEITSGQITNKNASWISAQLKTFGVETCLHLTAPDDRHIIAETLVYAEIHSDLIFVTGGLGPTSDDLTRDLISEWSELEMLFDDFSWKHIQDRLTSRGFPVRDIQRQQCYFPKGSTILTNRQGTANAFQLSVQKKSGLKSVFVLPGPPHEIAAIWDDHIHGWLMSNTKHIDKLITKAWDTLGVGESDVALKVEDVLKSAPVGISVDIGYRVHLPYVEVKLSFKESNFEALKPLLTRVDEALGSMTMTRDFADMAVLAAKHISKTDFTFYDFVTNGFLHGRLSPFLKGQKNWSWKQNEKPSSVELFQNEENFLAVLPLDENKILIIYEINGRRRQISIESPLTSALMIERRQQYFAEMVLVHLSHG